MRKTIETGEAHYFSRSRKKLWRKGEESGHVQRVVELRVDCDQDAVWLKVEQQGPGACHTGRRSCFYRAMPLGKAGAVTLEFRDADKTFDPKAVYPKTLGNARRLGARHELLRAHQMRPVIHLAVDADHAGAGLRRKRRDHAACACAIASRVGVNTSLMTGNLRRMDRHLAR